MEDTKALRRCFALLEGNEEDHGEALNRTGFWGAAGAGCLFFAEDSRRFLIAKRSRSVEQPGTYGGFGGAIDRGEDPLAAVRRETHEEAGYTGAIVRIEPMFVFNSGSFRYSNFLVIVPQEFKPVLNWENDSAVWCQWGDFPQNLHFGIVALLKDPASHTLMAGLAQG